jgi:hypothetical protein
MPLPKDTDKPDANKRYLGKKWAIQKTKI